MTARGVLYVVVCVAGPAKDAGRLVTAATERGWDVCVIATPAAADGEFIDRDALEAASGRPVRSTWRRSGEEKRNPPADAVVVAPMTMNTVNKWAAGIADTYALGLVAEAVGLGLPVVALPFWSTALDGHPATRRSVEVLRGTGVRVLHGEGEWLPHAPGTGGRQLDAYPWQLALDAVGGLKRG
ncbi:flavoprotein [Streptomyces sp. AV19]|uniref:flavoprotein n=1 Tax=Streptomyces sp. AV19 TaxID=2793068 RepID=UPI0018FEB587|nr:flavoprotein [Streptomyces sp. AV19]MBH1936592.1 flavoprotein [Streptomyces sp. AV19]MDG4532652.1 flavoprotein [Streptomyces sp. AV19]